MRLNKRRGIKNKDKPLPGALMVNGKDRFGNRILLPTKLFFGVYQSKSKRLYRATTASQAGEITRKYMDRVNEELAPYQVKGK